MKQRGDQPPAAKESSTIHGDALVAAAIELLVRGDDANATYVFPPGSDVVLARVLDEFLSATTDDDGSIAALERFLRFASILEIDEHAPLCAQLILDVLGASDTALRRLAKLDPRPEPLAAAMLKRFTGDESSPKAGFYGAPVPTDARPLSSFLNVGDQKARRGGVRLPNRRDKS